MKMIDVKKYPERSSMAKVSEHILSGFSLSTIQLFKNTKNKQDVYRSKDYMKKFCKYFRDHAMKIVNFKKKKNILTNEQQESNENAKISYICKEKFEDKNAKDKRYRKFRDHCNYADEYTGVAQSICNS